MPNFIPTRIPQTAPPSWGTGGGWRPPGLPFQLRESLLNRTQAPSWDMIQQIFGGLQGGQQDYQKWMSGLLGTMGTNARSQLAGGIGSQLSRTNVAVPGGANALANRYMGTLDDQFAMLQQMINQPSPYGQNLSQALSLAQGLAPTFQGRGVNTNKALEELSKLLGGGKRGWR